MTPPRDTLEKAWAALRADLVAAAAYNLSPRMVTATLKRHRPIIEAALRASAEAAPGPLDVPATFLAGIDSTHHSPESREAFIRLFYRDMRMSLRLAAAPEEGS